MAELLEKYKELCFEYGRSRNDRELFLELFVFIVINSNNGGTDFEAAHSEEIEMKGASIKEEATVAATWIDNDLDIQNANVNSASTDANGSWSLGNLETPTSPLVNSIGNNKKSTKQSKLNH